MPSTLGRLSNEKRSTVKSPKTLGQFTKTVAPSQLFKLKLGNQVTQSHGWLGNKFLNLTIEFFDTSLSLVSRLFVARFTV